MKWIDKTNEFEKYYESISDCFVLDQGLYFFGAGKIGNEVYSILNRICLINGFIDNNRSIIGTTVNGKRVFALGEVKNCKPFIVVTVASERYDEIRNQLFKEGYYEGKNFVYWETLIKKMLPVALNYQKGMNYVGLTQISLTERCTLSCVNCAHACNYVSIQSDDLPLEMVKESADAFFSICDYVHTFVLIGGEPLLYKNLAEVIEYIGKKYRNRIYRFQISTNGTILPSDDIKEKSKRYDVFYLISNYSVQIPKLKEQYRKLTETLNESGIEFALFPEETEWTDYGFQTVERDDDPQKLISVFDACHTECHEIRGKKFYYCVMARSVNENMNLGVGLDDYLDLDTLDPRSISDKRIFMEYSLGYSEKGYLEMCRFCNGAEREDHPIPAAVQGKRMG